MFTYWAHGFKFEIEKKPNPYRWEMRLMGKYFFSMPTRREAKQVCSIWALKKLGQAACVSKH